MENVLNVLTNARLVLKEHHVIHAKLGEIHEINAIVSLGIKLMEKLKSVSNVKMFAKLAVISRLVTPVNKDMTFNKIAKNVWIVIMKMVKEFVFLAKFSAKHVVIILAAILVKMVENLILADANQIILKI